MRKGTGCGMRSAVGFLSQRGLQGDPLLKEDFQRRRLQACRNLYHKDLLGHYGCVNAIEFSNNGGHMLVSGGDDRRVLLWHIEEAIHSNAKPIQLKGEHHSNIFCLAFNSCNTRVFSGGNDEQVILHDVERYVEWVSLGFILKEAGNDHKTMELLQTKCLFKGTAYLPSVQ